MIEKQKVTEGLAKGGGDTSTGSRKVPVQEPPTLAEAGIGKKLSARFQKLAKLDEDVFQEKKANWRDAMFLVVPNWNRQKIKSPPSMTSE